MDHNNGQRRVMELEKDNRFGVKWYRLVRLGAGREGTLDGNFTCIQSFKTALSYSFDQKTLLLLLNFSTNSLNLQKR